jgi:hypothetical protein
MARSRGLGDVYKRQVISLVIKTSEIEKRFQMFLGALRILSTTLCRLFKT